MSGGWRGGEGAGLSGGKAACDTAQCHQLIGKDKYHFRVMDIHIWFIHVHAYVKKNVSVSRLSSF